MDCKPFLFVQLRLASVCFALCIALANAAFPANKLRFSIRNEVFHNQPSNFTQNYKQTDFRQEITKLKFTQVFQQLSQNTRLDTCQDIRIRRNVLSLSDVEWAELVDVWQTMYRRGVYDDFAYIHTVIFAVVHDHAELLPWHRWFINLYENIMRSINPRVTLPYWDTSVEFRDMARSPVLQPARMGGESKPCIPNAFVSNWTMVWPEPHCLQRVYYRLPNGEIAPNTSPYSTTSLLQSAKDYDDFREKLEQGIHYGVHHGINGDLDVPHSPNDPIFYLHHSYIDRQWLKWQLSDPARNIYAYNGPSYNRDQNGRFVEATLDDLLTYYKVPIRDIMRVGVGEMCFSYDDVYFDDYPQVNGYQRNQQINRFAPKANFLGNCGRVAESRLRQLPEYLLREYFPRFWDGTANQHHVDFPDSFNCDVNRRMPLPYPILSNQEILANVGFNISKALKVVVREIELVERFNEYGVFSPW